MKIVKETVWNVVEHVTVRTLLERYKASKNNIHCMHGLRYAAEIYDDLYDFHSNWSWIEKQNPNKKLYVVDDVAQSSFLT